MGEFEHALIESATTVWQPRHDDGQRLSATLKASAEDFEVREEPAYQPTGSGDHIFLWVRKQNVSHRALLEHVASCLKVDAADIGTAGQKDTRAITWQQLSVPATSERLEALARQAVDDDGIFVEKFATHPGKLKTGHLRGNCFSLRLTHLVGQGSVSVAHQTLERRVTALQRQGLLNFYGPQRFGHHGHTLRQGLGLMGLGPRPSRLSGTLRRLALSAVQSALFNRWLNKRLDDGLGATVLAGDVMQVVASGGPFWAEDLQEVEARRQAGLVTISGPIFGPKMRQPRGVALLREEQILAESGLTMAHFAAQKKLCLGTRRAAVVPLGDIALRFEDDTTAVLRFALPPGAYATTLVAQLLDDVRQGGPSDSQTSQPQLSSRGLMPPT